LASDLHTHGITPVILGTAQEASLAKRIPNAIDLTGKTSFGDLADLARAARFAVGNDTGPMHMLASAGCPSVTLFSRDSDPALCAPVGRWTRVLRRDDLADLPLAAVLETLSDIPARP
jgi:ADP-heptose:LPS heptosyltransferase